jgi:galactokinase
VHEANAENFAKQIAARYQQKTGIAPQVYLCSAEDGAAELS